MRTNKTTLFNYKISYSNNYLHLLLGCMLFYMSTRYTVYIFEDSINSFISIIAIFLIIKSFLSCKSYYNYLPTSIRIIYILFIITSIIIILRGSFEKNFNYSLILADKRLIVNYLTPLLLLFPALSYKQRYLYYTCLMSAVLSIVFICLNYKELFIEVAVQQMGFFDAMTVNRASVAVSMLIPAMLFFIWNKTPKKVVLFIFICALFAVVASLLSGRRSSSFVILLFFAIYVVLNLKKIKRKWYIVIVIILIAFLNIDSITNLFNNKFDFLLSRISEDTRSGVEYYMIKDMDLLSWIFGRGMYGTYWCPTAIDQTNRQYIETGYLQMILKGGFIYLILYLILLCSATYKGLFKSRNSYAKCLGWYLLAMIILLYPGGHMAFNLQFYVVWYAVSLCNNKKFINMSDFELKKYW